MRPARLRDVRQAHHFDLLLPRLLADDPITAEDIARLGEGGLCLGCAECHWPNCGFGHC